MCVRCWLKRGKKEKEKSERESEGERDGSWKPVRGTRRDTRATVTGSEFMVRTPQLPGRRRRRHPGQGSLCVTIVRVYAVYAFRVYVCVCVRASASNAENQCHATKQTHTLALPLLNSL